MNSVIDEDIKEIIKRRFDWDSFSYSSILISGGSGFIATYIIETLMYLNRKKNLHIRVLAVVRNKEKAVKKFSQFIKSKELTLIVQDINKPIHVRRKIDFIIHAASHASPKFYSIDPVGTLKANTIGTMNLLELGRKKHIKDFLFISSAEIYGTFKNSQRAIPEDEYGTIDPTNIRSCYAESKRMGENICISWHHQYGIPVKIVRLFHTYGPGMSLDDGRVHADFVANIIVGQNILMKSEGKSYRTFCYIADAVSAIFAVLLKGQNGQVYNIGNDQAEIRIQDLAKLLSSIIPNRQVTVIQKRRTRKENYIESPIDRCKPNTTKVRQLGWNPCYDLKEGFSRTIFSYLS